MKSNKVKSRIHEMIDLEVNLFGEEDVDTQIQILNEQIKEIEDEINKILSVKRPKNKKIEDMPRIGAKYAGLVSNLETLNSQLSLYVGHLDLEKITHSSKTLSSISSKSSSLSSSSSMSSSSKSSMSSKSSSSKSKRKSEGKGNKKRTRKSRSSSEDTLEKIDRLEF